ncbi:MAG: DUF86 domain-containing protein [Nitrospinae bacterium]|nr:DUF86 domain-containing protein [Nitrospinota bacterium]
MKRWGKRKRERRGEEGKKGKEERREKYNEVKWRKIAGLRDILIHHYFGIDLEIVWDIVQNKLPDLERQIEAILRE